MKRAEDTTDEKVGPAVADRADRSATLADLAQLLQGIESRLAEQSAAALGREGAAHYIGVSPSTLDRLTSAGKIKSVRVSAGRM